MHINSGIPNRAFALAALELGGFSWEKAGQVWYDALTAGELTPRSDFAAFARATMNSAARRFPEDPAVADAVRRAWETVGVLGTWRCQLIKAASSPRLSSLLGIRSRAKPSRYAAAAGSPAAYAPPNST